MYRLIQPSKEWGWESQGERTPKGFEPFLEWRQEGEDSDTSLVYHIPLERCTYGVPPADVCQVTEYDACIDCAKNHEDGITVLSDNEFHPGVPAWFADKIDEVVNSCDINKDDLITSLCAFNPEERIDGYVSLVSYFGPFEFDQYPTQKPLED